MTQKTGKGDNSGQPGLFNNQLGTLFENLMDVSSLAVKYAAKSTSSGTAALLKTPENLELMGKAGSALKDLRVTAGYSLEELADTLDVDNPNLLQSIEDGKAALPMNLLLRMSSLYSRNDPLPFVMRFSRTYHPSLSNILNKSGLDGVIIKAERELKLVNIYRSKDEARQLSDEGFDKVLEFTNKAFNMALHFVSEMEANADYPETTQEADSNELEQGTDPDPLDDADSPQQKDID